MVPRFEGKARMVVPSTCSILGILWLPRPREIVQLPDRQRLVEDVTPGAAPEQAMRVSLVCLDEEGNLERE
jgi:hypothetical protein